jgi:hypothetical protein
MEYDGEVMQAPTMEGRMRTSTTARSLTAKSLVGKMRNGSLREKYFRFARYAARRLQRDAGAGNSSLAYMVAREESAEDSRILAILDRGCNNTCHGDQSMQRFAEAHGHLPEIEEAMGKFCGVGGKVMVAGKRAIQ